MKFHGKRIQVDVKQVPAACLVGERVKNSINSPPLMNIHGYDIWKDSEEANTYSSICFLKNAIAFLKKHSIEIKSVSVLF